MALSQARFQLPRVVALCTLLVLVPALFVGGAQPVAVGLFPVPWDKAVHLGVFGIFAGLIGTAAGLLRLPPRVLLLLAFVGAVAIGAADELHQATLPGRSADWDDFAADTLGAALGTWLLARIGLVR